MCVNLTTKTFVLIPKIVGCLTPKYMQSTLTGNLQSCGDLELQYVMLNNHHYLHITD